MLTPHIISQSLLESVEKDNFCGYDPFDGLNSKLFQLSGLNKYRIFRLAWLQLHKRLIINFRPLVGIQKKRNPKGVALFILGMLYEFKTTGNNELLIKATELGDWLLSQACDRIKWKHFCWGYHFDWQAKAFYVPIGKPNVISTVYASRALNLLSEVTHDPRYKAAAYDAALFISKNLYIEETKYFSYIPGESALVHNANLWAAAWCVFVGSKTKNQELINKSLSAAETSIKAQSNDGSWQYGERAHHNFIDGFHTGYNLEALSLIRTSLNTDNFDKIIEQGYTYYRENFFESDGTAKYYNNSAFPVDTHNFSQAIITLIEIGGIIQERELLQKLVNNAIGNLYLPKRKRFIYQKGRFITNKVNYTRWTQAWAYYSLSLYNYHSR